MKITASLFKHTRTSPLQFENLRERTLGRYPYEYTYSLAYLLTYFQNLNGHGLS